MRNIVFAVTVVAIASARPAEGFAVISLSNGLTAQAWMASAEGRDRPAASGVASDQRGSGPVKAWKQRQFLVTFWLPPPATDEALADVAAEHFNLTWVPVEGLDVAARHGLRAMLQNNLLSPDVLEDPAKRTQLDALIEKVKHHPALEAYCITDEPGAGAFPALGKLVAYLRERDPAHLAYINLFPTYASEAQLGVSADAAERAKVGYPQNFAGVGMNDKTVLAYREHVKKFVEIVKPDLISYDHYHFLKTGDGQQYFLNLALIRMAALEAKKPFLNVIQACSGEPTWRLPDAAETRWLIYTTMAYGGRGISYFVYWGSKSYGGLHQDGKPGPMAKDVAALNAEIAKVGPALLELDSLGVYHTAPLPYGTEAIPPDAPVQIVGSCHSRESGNPVPAIPPDAAVQIVGKGEFVLGLFGPSGRVTGFMIVNRSYKEPAEAMLKVAIPGRKLQELDRKTGKWSDGETLGADRTVTIKLDRGDGRLLRIVE